MLQNIQPPEAPRPYFGEGVFYPQAHYGKTRSYAQLATTIGKSSAFRAAANANGANQFAIVIPCHRVINSNGDLGGYGGGIPRKKWLINHEKRNH